MGIALTKQSIDLGIVTSNGPAMLAFYRDLLGLKDVGEMAMTGNGVMHRLMCGDSLIKLRVMPAEHANCTTDPPLALVLLCARHRPLCWATYWV